MVNLADCRVTGWPTGRLPPPALLAAATWVDCEYNDLLLVVNGQVEAMVVPGRIWDHAPFDVLLDEAGGSLLDPHGGGRIDLGAALYTNGRIDEALRAMLEP
jgi:fructose-1,6-bisphosphatase/inositol monophosphatase family enzyme